MDLFTSFVTIVQLRPAINLMVDSHVWQLKVKVKVEHLL